MEFADLKRKNEKELQKVLREKRNELRELRFKASEGQLKNVNTIRKTRRMIAQVMTLLDNKTIEKVNN